MKNYYRVMLGRRSVNAAAAFEHGVIGADFGIPQDLSADLPEDWRAFNHEFSPITQYAADLEKLTGGSAALATMLADAAVEEQIAFALEKHLEDFLVQNWAQPELGKDCDIFEEDGETRGQQYPTDTGPMDVRGVIIAQEDDQRIRRALAVAPNISFMRYQVSFKLLKV